MAGESIPSSSIINGIVSHLTRYYIHTHESLVASTSLDKISDVIVVDLIALVIA